jgi:CheY-like chemotaxis protein
MLKILANLEFWKLLAQLAWPIVILIIFFCLLPVLRRLLSRENLDVEVAGIKIGVREVTKNTGDQLAALQETVARLQKSIVSTADPLLTRAHAQHRTLTMLWVDDQPENNAFLVERLRNGGDTVRLCNSTLTAIELLKARDFDLVISDMGRLENGTYVADAGLKLIRAIRSLGYQTPVIVFSTDRSMALEPEVKEAGGQGITTSAVEVLTYIEFLRR